MTRMVTTLADRIVGMVVPRVEARASDTCYEKFCYCRGLSLYTQWCCPAYPCKPCRYVGEGC
ncbi:hypothetical protein NLX85_11845 [Micromonospora sp. A3M-1-15]|uniref:hypothetical protein n=1 Tax=Micromonospora sp. A3M-1-15 TaxID=2962035 RepID=UPI0020B63D41|nr:hypothetical protein [Micromonospora sp. A3M-1-15]MCP3784060.1 hypothetical protein [Micromonospora sp. A3M-1-15]